MTGHQMFGWMLMIGLVAVVTATKGNIDANKFIEEFQLKTGMVEDKDPIKKIVSTQKQLWSNHEDSELSHLGWKVKIDLLVGALLIALLFIFAVTKTSKFAK